MTTPIPEADMRTQLEETFASVRSRREAKEAAQRAADAVPTDNIEVLRERAERHAHHAVDAYWGHFNDIQRQLGEQVITPLLHTVARIAAERDALAPCADCGHVEAAHSKDGETDCNASGARLCKCTCAYFIPGGAS